METAARFAQRLLVPAAVVAAAAAALIAPSPAAAATPSPGQIAAIDQYYETFPTSSGGTLARGGGATGRTVSPALESRIRSEAGPDADALIDLAATAGPAAPEETEEEAAGDAETDAGDEAAGALPVPEEPSFAGALVEASGAPGSERGLLLAAVLVATTVGIAAAALRRRGPGSDV